MNLLVSLLKRGLARALHHPWLIALCYLVALVPALMPAMTFSVTTAGTLDRSLMSDRILEGDWHPVMVDLLGSRGGVSPLPPSLVVTMFLLSIALQVVLAAVVVERLLDRHDSIHGPSLASIARSCRRFWRSWLWFILALTMVVIAAALVRQLLSNLAVEYADARLDLVAIAVAGGLLLLLFVPLDLAYDLSRIASARHDDSSTLLGFLRAFGTVVRQPRLLLPLYGILALLPLLLHLAFLWLHRPMPPVGSTGILIVLLLQQLLMLVRAGLKLWFWGAELECYRSLGEPRWCQGPPEPPPPPAPVVSRLPAVAFD